MALRGQFNWNMFANLDFILTYSYYKIDCTWIRHPETSPDAYSSSKKFLAASQYHTMPPTMRLEILTADISVPHHTQRTQKCITYQSMIHPWTLPRNYGNDKTNFSIKFRLLNKSPLLHFFFLYTFFVSRTRPCFRLENYINSGYDNSNYKDFQMFIFFHPIEHEMTIFQIKFFFWLNSTYL